MAGNKKIANAKKKGNNNKKMSTKTSKVPMIKETLSKGNIIRIISDSTAVSKKEVSSIIECLSQVIEKHLKMGGPGKFVLPGLLKMTVIKKAARPARKGVNPFTGEEIMIKAKPAYKTVKIRALKKLKEMVA